MLACNYVVINVGDPLRGEWTNVGVIVFGPDGKQFGFRIDSLDRAIRRGDLEPDVLTPERLAEFAASLPDVDSVERRYDSTSQACGLVRISGMGSFKKGWSNLDLMFERHVA